MSAEAIPRGQRRTQARQSHRRWQAVAKCALKDVKDDDIPGLGAEIAYHAIFAIPPLIIFVVTMAAAINEFTGVPVAERLIDVINRSAPGDTRELLTNIVQKAVADVNGGLVSFGVAATALLALWSGSNGVATLIKAFNRAYDVVEERSFVRKKLVALFLTVLIAVMVNAAFVLFVFGGQIGRWLADQIGLGSQFTTGWDIARWPLAIIFVMFVLALLYYLGPNVEQSFRWISPGSVTATLLWIAIVFGFKLYLKLSDPGSAYGALGSIVVLLFFLYLSGIAFAIGAEVNAILGRRYDPETIDDLAGNPQKIPDAGDRAAARRRARELNRRDVKEVAAAHAGDRIADRPARVRATSHWTRGVLSGVASVVLAIILAVLSRRSSRL